MSRQRNREIIVLKFGSSILADASCVRLAAKEIGRAVSAGTRVVAVVSAVKGETDRLFEAVEEVDVKADPYRTATFVATGELQSACLLRIALSSIDVSAKLATHEDIGLIAEGDPLDSDPCAINDVWVRQQFETVDVLVTPGFVAKDKTGRDVLLGRGGSDDSALFVAHRLRANCRLVKDVDGIFEYDPNLDGPTPRKYQSISWNDAISVAGVLVQPKAIEFARSNKMEFDVVALESGGGTKVGPGPSKFGHDTECVRIV